MVLYNLLWVVLEVLTADFLIYWMYPLICIYLIGCVPALIRSLYTWR